MALANYLPIGCLPDVDQSPKGLIFNIMHFSLHDGPGIRTTVFFKGCPLDCWWCHNPESCKPAPELMYSEDRCVRCGDCVPACPSRATEWRDGPVWDVLACKQCGACADVCPSGARELIGRWMTADEVLTEICKDTVFFDESGGGVTFSGGEPLMQPSFLETLLDACRERRIHTTVDTCGAASRDNLLRLCGKVDLFLYDLKLMDPTRHRKYTGVDNSSIVENLKALAGAHNAIIVRIPVIPRVNDGEQDIERALKFLSSMGLFRVDLLPYHEIGTDKYRRLGREFRLEGIKPPPAGQMQVIADCFSRNGFTVRIGD